MKKIGLSSTGAASRTAQNRRLGRGVRQSHSFRRHPASKSLVFSFDPSMPLTLVEKGCLERKTFVLWCKLVRFRCDPKTRVRTDHV